MNVMSALCDGILGAVCLFAAYTFVRRKALVGWYSGLAFGGIGFAAVLGSIKYSGLERGALYSLVESLHYVASGLGGYLWVPMIGACWVYAAWKKDARFLHNIMYFLAIASVMFAGLGLVLWRLVISGAGMLAVIVAANKSATRGISGAGLMGFLGAALTLAAGLVIGTKGSVMGILRLDIFHLVLAIANALLALGLLRIMDANLKES